MFVVRPHLQTDQIVGLALGGFSGDFSPHGISVWKDPQEDVAYVAVVNHKRDGSVVEIFSHSL
ncbi:hypothetical protein HDU91_006753, partial [Kappamyces sp. JEL0680]